MSIEHENEHRRIYGRTAQIPASFIPERVEDFVPRITNKEISVGEIFRYFVRSTNNASPGEIIEVSPSTFNKLRTNRLYTVVSVRWLIRGSKTTTTGLTDTNEVIILQHSVHDANKKFIEIANQTLSGLSTIITNYMRFYQGD